eukprot:1161820-Pelagomonas_calceolata.AAC.3
MYSTPGASAPLLLPHHAFALTVWRISQNQSRVQHNRCSLHLKLNKCSSSESNGLMDAKVAPLRGMKGGTPL